MRTRRTAAVLLTAVVMITGGSLSAEATHEVRQDVRGQVLVPTGTRTAGPVWVGACTFVHAVARWVAGAHGVFAYRFHVHPDTRGHPFRLSAAVPADLDIIFYGGGKPKAFETRGLDVERGIVPTGADHAYVCLAGGAPAARFLYMAGPGVGS